MYETTYHRPSSVDEAAALFAKGSESKYLAGGHTLIPVMKQRLASPSDVIDLGKLKDLIGIEVAKRIYDLRTKAGLTQRELAKKVGTTASVICRLEDVDYEGQSLSMMKRIAAALDKRVEIRFVGLRKPAPESRPGVRRKAG